VLTRTERNVVIGVSLGLVLVTVGNTLLMARGYRISLYLRSRDVGVIALAAVLLLGNVAALRRNPQESRFFTVLLGLATTVGVAHLLRLLDGGFLCR
jgi:hypothetical protein